jgi:type IV secretory pathway TraG/TraD family ATPase VirD4
VYLTNYTEISDAVKPVLSFFIEMTGKRVLSLPDDLQRRFFVFIDEFGTLQNMQTMPVMLTNGRSKGLSIWLAVQDISQIENVYGRETAQTIVNSCSNSFIFSVNDPNTAEYLSRKIGEHEVAIFRQSKNSPSDVRSWGSTTKSQDEKNERVFLPSEIMDLPTLSFLFKLADLPVTPLKLDIVNFPDVNQPFEMSKSFGFSVDTSNPEITESKKVITKVQKTRGKTTGPFELDEL